MDERYVPPSDFLKAVINEEVCFRDGEFGEGNLARLIAMTSHRHPANRDWATLLLSQLDIDRPDVRDALIRASSDECADVRSEAILGLASRDRATALPLVLRELQGGQVNMALLEAATIVADASLINDLEAFAAPSANRMLDELVADALRACRAAS